MSWYTVSVAGGAIPTADGVPKYIAPVFEIGTLSEYQQIKSRSRSWEEDENPINYRLATLAGLGVAAGRPSRPGRKLCLFIVDALATAGAIHAVYQQFCGDCSLSPAEIRSRNW